MLVKFRLPLHLTPESKVDLRLELIETPFLKRSFSIEEDTRNHILEQGNNLLLKFISDILIKTGFKDYS
jgi:hypothetical protein